MSSMLLIWVFLLFVVVIVVGTTNDHELNIDFLYYFGHSFGLVYFERIELLLKTHVMMFGIMVMLLQHER